MINKTLDAFPMDGGPGTLPEYDRVITRKDIERGLASAVRFANGGLAPDGISPNPALRPLKPVDQATGGEQTAVPEVW